jgi:hypothetical protein
MPLKALQKMRIIALPLTRPVGRAPQALASGSGLDRLTYYQLQISGGRKRAGQGDSTSTGDKGKGPDKGWRAWPAQIRAEGLADWTTHKATEVWSGFGRAKGGWQVCLWTSFRL